MGYKSSKAAHMKSKRRKLANARRARKVASLAKKK